jgi:peptide-methionine (R)-S-oxide reductase
MMNPNFAAPPLSRPVNRRAFIVISASALAGLAIWRFRKSGQAEADATPVPAVPPQMISIVDFSSAGARTGAVTVPKIVKSDVEWRKQLSANAFDITRRADTEMAFTGAYWNLHEAGLYRCICCDTALFNSNTKFDSGTGWPSFWAPIAKENIAEQTDSTFGMLRNAVACRRCDAHLGHVFDDGPKPTGLRYCMNSASLHFVKFSEDKKES